MQARSSLPANGNPASSPEPNPSSGIEGRAEKEPGPEGPRLLAWRFCHHQRRYIRGGLSSL